MPIKDPSGFLKYLIGFLTKKTLFFIKNYTKIKKPNIEKSLCTFITDYINWPKPKWLIY